MLFGRKKKGEESSSSLSRDLMTFLNNADAAYMRAFMARDIVVLGQYFTRECCVSLSHIIVSEAPMRYFANEKFRETKWSLRQECQEKILLRKSVCFDSVKVASVRMKISTDYQEDWDLVVTGKSYMVENVNMLQEGNGEW